LSGLTEKQEQFCQEYLIDFNGGAAAIRAKYSKKTAYEIAYENLRKPQIQTRLAELMKARAKRTEITQDRVLEELAYIAFFDIRKLFDDEGNLIPITKLDEQTARALASVDVLNERVYKKGDMTVQEYIKKLKSLDKKAALELLGKHLGMFTDTIRIEDVRSNLNDWLAGLRDAVDDNARGQIERYIQQRSGAGIQRTIN